jgi:undecaprenyl diphosphate synthase
MVAREADRAAVEHAPTRLPRHLAISVDGNGRWAEARGLPRSAGHRAGAEACVRLVETCLWLGIPVLSMYVFSTENWRRPAPEVREILRLVGETLRRYRDPFVASGVRLRHLGRTAGLPDELVACIRDVETATAGNDRLQFNLAVNYGGRAEIVDAVRQLAAGGADLTRVTEDDIAAHLATVGLPDPDLLIRTSGEQRFSNFMLWQAADAACAFVEPCWPEFGEADLLAVLDRYALRATGVGDVPWPRSSTASSAPCTRRDGGNTASRRSWRSSGSAAAPPSPPPTCTSCAAATGAIPPSSTWRPWPTPSASRRRTSSTMR